MISKKTTPVHTQYKVPKKTFDAFDKEQSVKQALGSDRTSSVREVAELRSTSFKIVNGVITEGWRLTRRGLEIAGGSSTFPPGSIPLSVIQDITTGVILGRTTAGSGVTEQLTASQVRTIIDFVEQAQDAVGTILVDSASIDFTYNDGVPSITATTIGASGTFLSGDVIPKLVTVANGLITSIV